MTEKGKRIGLVVYDDAIDCYYDEDAYELLETNPEKVRDIFLGGDDELQPYRHAFSDWKESIEWIGKALQKNDNPKNLNGIGISSLAFLREEFWHCVAQILSVLVDTKNPPKCINLTGLDRDISEGAEEELRKAFWGVKEILIQGDTVFDMDRLCNNVLAKLFCIEELHCFGRLVLKNVVWYSARLKNSGGKEKGAGGDVDEAKKNEQFLADLLKNNDVLQKLAVVVDRWPLENNEKWITELYTCHLRRLDLASDGEGGKVVEGIAKVLLEGGLVWLEELILEDCRLDFNATKALSNVLRYNHAPRLQVLWTDVQSKKEFLLIAKSLCFNRSLVELSVVCVEEEEHCEDWVEKALGYNFTLRYLHLGWWSIDVQKWRKEGNGELDRRIGRSAKQGVEEAEKEKQEQRKKLFDLFVVFGDVLPPYLVLDLFYAVLWCEIENKERKRGGVETIARSFMGRREKELVGFLRIAKEQVDQRRKK